MTGRALGLCFVTVLVAALILSFPLRALLSAEEVEPLGLSASSVEGTIWRGRLAQASLLGFDLGSVRVGLDPLALGMGTAGLKLVTDGAFDGRGALLMRRSGLSLKGVSGQLAVRDIIAASPVQGRVRLDDLDLETSQGRCSKASGKISAHDLRFGPQLSPLPGLVLVGDAQCRDGELLILLEGGSSAARVTSQIHIEDAGRYRMEVVVTSASPIVAAAMASAGAERTLAGYRLQQEGVMLGA